MPVESVLAANRIEAVMRSGLSASGGQLWGFERAGELTAVCWSGANLVPVVPAGTEDAIDAFAVLARAQGRHCSSIVGESGAALGLWSRLAGAWSRPREIRGNQPSLAIDCDPLVEPDPFVRRSLESEYDLILPACVQMFTEEVGYSPASGANGPYETRVRSLIADDRSFVRLVRGPGGVEVAFKAELGAVAGKVAQVQGVWVAPALRGRRLSESGMAAVVAMTRAEVAPIVSLYVNDYNIRALAAYYRVGFHQVGTFATVLF
jgi:ribosomal protein S18 acetylase RimI-like enzyme